MDQKILFLINNYWSNPALDRLMTIVSNFDFWRPFLIIAVILIAILGGFHARAMLLAIALSIGVSDGIFVNSLKHLVDRPRPHEMLQGVRTLDMAKAKLRFLAIAKPLIINYSLLPKEIPHHGHSFPSGHASNNFAFATVLTVFYRRWGWLAYLPALLVSYSRIYVGAHWPSDVLFSCILGAGITLVVLATLEWCWRKYGDRFFSKLYSQHPSLIAE